MKNNDWLQQLGGLAETGCVVEFVTGVLSSFIACPLPVCSLRFLRSGREVLRRDGCFPTFGAFDLRCQGASPMLHEVPQLDHYFSP